MLFREGGYPQPPVLVTPRLAYQKISVVKVPVGVLALGDGGSVASVKLKPVRGCF